MTPLNSFKNHCLGALTTLLLFATMSGCSSNNGSCKGCVQSDFKPNADIKFIDPDTKQDLFFGPGQKFSYAQVKIRHVQHGAADSLAAPVRIDSAKRTFNIDLRYEYDVDTLTVQVGTLKPQVLYLNTSILPSCCARIIINSATYQNKLIFQAPTDPAKLIKSSNEITVPFQLN